MDKNIINSLCGYGLLQDIDICFADLMTRLAGQKASPELYLAAALLSNITTDEKHVCLDLTLKAGKSFRQLFSEVPDEEKAAFSRLKAPGLDRWLDKLQGCPVVGSPGEYKPLILDHQKRLYLYRYWEYEKQLAASIKKRLSLKAVDVDLNLLKEGLRRYFKNCPTSPDWQKIAAFAALTNNFCIITGGPGTGKTFTVTGILALLLEQNRNLKIKLCAPTGKAAARLQESIRNTKTTLQCPNSLKEKIIEEAATIHRLLGYKPLSPYFRHNRGNPLSADVLIVDEASMVPLALMAKLIQAVPDRTKIVLLGDKDQLASVEAGAILADICEASEISRFSTGFCAQYKKISGEEINTANQSDSSAALIDCTVELQHSYRFEPKHGIGILSKAVNAGNAGLAIKLIKNDPSGTINHADLPEKEMLEHAVAAIVEANYRAGLSASKVSDAFDHFNKFRVLCSLRKGLYGVEKMNQIMEKILGRKKLIDSNKQFYKGRPIMITRNDYNLQLFNGDIGILWDDDNGEFRAYFPDKNGTFRSFAFARLPEHETVYAMTVHKSQGSEFDDVLLVLPDQSSSVLTRELIYTAITRARKSVSIWGLDTVLTKAVENRIERTSGLREALTQNLQ
jgi:exodeoxyribonuclease V alpha subunit